MSKPWLVNIYIYVMSAYWLWREFWRELFGYKPTFLSEAASKMNFADSRQRLSAWRKGIITAMMLLGCAVGSFCGGSLADHLGCKRLILYRVIYMLWQSMPPSFVIFRELVGFAVGTTFCVVPRYLGELAPS